MIRRLFNNRCFVIGLAACSLALMLYSVSAPFLEDPEFGDAEDPEFYLITEEVDDGAESAAVRPGRSVLSGQLTWNASPRRNPFGPLSGEGAPVTLVSSPVAVPGPSGLPRLDALVAGPESLLAVLDDRIVREGDRIGDYRVDRIRADGVRIVSRDRSHWLSVGD